MFWLYRLQQRLSITRRESIAILTLVGLLFVGWTVQYVQRQMTPPLEESAVVAAPTDSVRAALSSSASAARSRPININSASREKLQTLSGIGPALSRRIVNYRTTHDSFQQVDDLERVRGIGPKTLASLRPRITVHDPASDTVTALESGGVP